MQSIRLVLRLNALTCLVFGVVFVAASDAVSQFLGGFPPLWLRLLGIGLVLHSLHLILAARQSKLGWLLIGYFAVADLLWFLASLLILACTDLISRPAGAQATLGVALMVAFIGIVQLWAFAEENASGLLPEHAGDLQTDSKYLPAHLTRAQAIGHSWLAIKSWVKYWLFTLNAVFLAAFCFSPLHLAKVTLLAYLASMPLLLSIMVVQRGLSKLLGIGHLLVWIPLLIYLLLRLGSDWLGPQLTSANDALLYCYVLLLSGFISICLGFDLYDCIRWWRGDRARLGSPREQQQRRLAR